MSRQCKVHALQHLSLNLVLCYQSGYCFANEGLRNPRKTLSQTVVTSVCRFSTVLGRMGIYFVRLMARVEVSIDVSKAPRSEGEGDIII
jgi:hypothetical protein